MGIVALDALIDTHSPVRDYRMQEPSGTLCEDFGIDGADMTHTAQQPSGDPAPTAGAAGPFDFLAVDYSSVVSSTKSTSSLTIADDQTFIILAKSASSENPGANEYLANSQEDASNSFAIMFQSDGTVRFTHKLVNTSRSWYSTGDFYDAEWHTFSFTVDHSGTSVVGYVDGVAVANTTDALGIATNTGFFTGARHDFAGFPFAGLMARTTVINAVLDPDEHAAIHAAVIAGGDKIVRPNMVF